MLNNRLVQLKHRLWPAAEPGLAQTPLTDNRAVWWFLLLLLPAAVALVLLSLQLAVAFWKWLLLFLALAGLLSVWLLAHRLTKISANAQHLAAERHRLEHLALALLQEPAEESDLPSLLSQHLPPIFANGWVEIRLLPDTVLYAQGDEWLPLANDQWAALLAETTAPVVVPGLSEAAEWDFGPEALVIPICIYSETAVGGIFLMRARKESVRAWESVGQSLAAILAAGLQRDQRFDEALTAQAEIYQKEIYEQAYQAELYAVALEYEKVSKELMAAGQVQATFLPPEVPHVDGWQLAVTLEPAREMSGDFYDIIPLSDGRIGLVIADVADKGMGSALFMAMSRTLIRTFAPDFVTAPAKVLWAANQRILADTSSDLFVTAFYAVLEPETGLLTYCNAGHNPPYLYSAGGDDMKMLTRTAIPLGIMDGMPWEQEQVQIKPGELLLMYTDGVTEAEDEEALFFGEARLQAVAKANLGRSVDIIESKVVTAVLDFVGDAPQFDDITLMILARDAS